MLWCGVSLEQSQAVLHSARRGIAPRLYEASAGLAFDIRPEPRAYPTRIPFRNRAGKPSRINSFGGLDGTRTRPASTSVPGKRRNRRLRVCRSPVAPPPTPRCGDSPRYLVAGAARRRLLRRPVRQPPKSPSDRSALSLECPRCGASTCYSLYLKQEAHSPRWCTPRESTDGVLSDVERPRLSYPPTRARISTWRDYFEFATYQRGSGQERPAGQRQDVLDDNPSPWGSRHPVAHHAP
jgi:hypothetical protein